MNFGEIPMGTKVQVVVTNGGDTQAKFLSRVMRAGEKTILVIPFMHKGLRVNFRGEKVRIHMEVADAKGDIWTFKGCQIDLIRKNGLVYHRVTTKMREGIENRRGERRTFVWQPAVFAIEGHAEQLFTTLKDLSPSGFGFVVDVKKRMNIPNGKTVTCTINEKDGNIITIRGKVIRREKMDDYVLYGCRCGESNPAILDYIRRVRLRNEAEQRENDNEGFGEEKRSDEEGEDQGIG